MKPDKLIELLKNQAEGTSCRRECFQLLTSPSGPESTKNPDRLVSVFPADVLELVNEFKRLKQQEINLICIQTEWGR